MSRSTGAVGELIAKQYLLAQGLRWITSNYYCLFGEIDLIMRDGEYLVFVEVKQRRSMAFGGALASVTWQKQKKIIKTAQYYQLTQKQSQNLPCRFDLLTLQGTPPIIDWIKNAINS